MSDFMTIYRPKPGDTPVDELVFTLAPYGLKKSDLIDADKEHAPIRSDGTVDLIRLHDLLPDELVGEVTGPNPAKAHIAKYVRALPAALRGNVRLSPQHVNTLIMERAGHFEELAYRLVRICRGGPKPVLDSQGNQLYDDNNKEVVDRGCEHFSVCPYAASVAANKLEDRRGCAYERATVQHEVDQWINEPKARGERPQIDPTRPNIAVLFEHAVHLRVFADRYQLEMAMEPISKKVVGTIGIGGGRERVSDPGELGEMENPMMKGLVDLKMRYQKVIESMGLDPASMKKRGEWVSEEEKEDTRSALNQEINNIFGVRYKQAKAILEEARLKFERGDPDITERDLVMAEGMVMALDMKANEDEIEI